MASELVFIACGQLTQDEKALGEKIKNLVKKPDINVFLAEAAHDLVDLNSHIFKNLSQCTRFIAVLHKRNKINQKYDTSVWINQEIAIIAYLNSLNKKIPSLILLEDGAEQEGLMKYTIANPPIFSTEQEALQIITEWIKEGDFAHKELTKDAVSELGLWRFKSRERGMKALGEMNEKTDEPQVAFWEVACSPYFSLAEKENTVPKLISIAEKAIFRLSGWPIGVVLTRDDARPKARKFGIVATIESDSGGRLDYWELQRNGRFYSMRTFEDSGLLRKKELVSKHVLFFDISIRRIAEALLYCQNLYKLFEFKPKQPFNFHIRYLGLQGRTLEVANGTRLWIRGDPYRCDEQSYEFSKQLSIDSINTDFNSIVYETTRELFELFNFHKYTTSVCDSIINKLLKRG